MSENFKERLKAYRDGNLTEEEKKKIEEELDKLEEYQTIIIQELNNYENMNCNKEIKSENNKYEKKLIKRAKWKARISSAFTSMMLIIVIAITCYLATANYYAFADRGQLYDEIVRSTIQISEPNTMVGFNSRKIGFFTRKLSSDVSISIGSKSTSIKKLETTFLLNKCISSKSEYFPDYPSYSPYFFRGGKYKSAWEPLEILPEGTVSEVFISLDKHYDVDEIMDKFYGSRVAPLWIAVYTNDDAKENEHRSYYPVGIPVLGLSTASTDDFVKTLKLLKKNEKIANKVANIDLFLQERIDYIDKNGIKGFGVVVTGPTKEILKLKNEEWISTVRIRSTALWNYDTK